MGKDIKGEEEKQIKEKAEKTSISLKTDFY